MKRDDSFFTLRRLLLTRFNHFQGFIQPAKVRFLKFNGKASNQTEVGIILTCIGIGVWAFVVMPKCSLRWEGKPALSIAKQVHLMLNDTGTQVASKITRRSEGAEQNFEQ